MKSLPDPARFVSKPAVIKAPYSGSSMRGLDAGEMVQEILGPFDWGKATAYMIRRFGPFNKPCDPDRDIAAWAITTPMKGLILTFRSATSASRLLFGWIAPEAMFKDLMRCKYAREERWRNGFQTWCETTRNVDWPPQNQFKEWKDQYEAEHPPVTSEDLLFHAQAALRRTITDLLRTVSVRDTDISILGEAECRFGHVKAHDNGGDYLPPVAYHDEMWKVYREIDRLGGGRKGLAKLIAAASIEG